MTSCFGAGAVIILALLGAGMSLLPPRVPTSHSSSLFTDMSGRDLDLARPPRNVVVLAPVLSPYAAIAGNLKDVDAVSDFVRRNENTGAFRLVFPHLATMPIVSLTGAVPDPEQVLRFSPDAVLAWRLQSDALRDTGYPGLVELEWNAKIDGDAERLWDFLGKLLNEEPRSRSIWQKAQARQRELRAILQRLDTIKVLIMSPYRDATAWIGQKGYFLNPLLRDLRAVNLTGDLHLGDIISAEQILRYDPDIILVPSWTDDDDLADIYGNPVWQALQAVRGKRVYLLPRTSQFNAPVEVTPLFFWLAEILHPTLSSLTRHAYHSVYQEVYGRNLNDKQIDFILRLQKNEGSFGYERFSAASSPAER